MTAIPKPRTFGNPARLPTALLPLAQLRRWVIWRWERRENGKWTKPPYQPRYPKAPAKSDDAATWGTYDEAVLALAQGLCDGIGLMLKDSELGAVDLDHIRDFATGRVLRWAEELFIEAAQAGCYIEWTVSGTGARIIGIARGSELHRRIAINRETGCGVEFYRHCARFITVSCREISGDYPGLPVPCELPDYDGLFDTLFARFCDNHQRPSAGTCEFGGGALITIEEVEERPGADFFDFNTAGPQDVIDYDELITNGAPQGDRSEEFQRTVWHLAAQGRSAEEIADELAKHPNGIGAKYAGRLLVEVQRSYGKWQRQRQTSAIGALVGTSNAANANASASTGAGASPNGTPGLSPSTAASVSTSATRIWPTIYIHPGEIPRVINEAEAALLHLDREIYQYAGMLVEPQLMLIKASGGRQFVNWRLAETTVMNVVEYFSCAARFLKFDRRSRGWVQTDPPEKVAKGYLDRKKKSVPQIIGIANAPFLRIDGTICDHEGYDPATSILCKWNGAIFPAIPLNPTRNDALKAMKVLEEPLTEFPFESPADKSAALSAILTPLDRRSIDIVPLHAVSAPAGGMGKGLLMDVIAMISTGRPMPSDNQGPNEEEQEKRLGSSVIQGDSLIGIDNCERALEGSFLCSLVTQQLVRVRVLGESRKVEYPNCASVFANGNNLVVGADMTRRVIRCVINAKMEQPQTRKFKNNRLLETVRANRVELVLAGLTLLRAWHIARVAESVELTPLDFVVWSERVRAALVWLGRADPGDTMEHAREDDPDRIKRSTLFTEWHRVIGERSVPIRDVIAEAFGNPDLYAALLEVAAAHNGREISRERLGRWLVQNKDKIVGNLTLVRAGFAPSGSPIWRMRKG